MDVPATSHQYMLEEETWAAVNCGVKTHWVCFSMGTSLPLFVCFTTIFSVNAVCHIFCLTRVQNVLNYFRLLFSVFSCSESSTWSKTVVLAMTDLLTLDFNRSFLTAWDSVKYCFPETSSQFCFYIVILQFSVFTSLRLQCRKKHVKSWTWLQVFLWCVPQGCRFGPGLFSLFVSICVSVGVCGCVYYFGP